MVFLSRTEKFFREGANIYTHNTTRSCMDPIGKRRYFTIRHQKSEGGESRLASPRPRAHGYLQLTGRVSRRRRRLERGIGCIFVSRDFFNPGSIGGVFTQGGHGYKIPPPSAIFLIKNIWVLLYAG